ncbi:transposable element Tcb1 transposase [Trichonephila clavipes]|nr:transposable element Tcb1 transposase [Trichonephila clavipes]
MHVNMFSHNPLTQGRGYPNRFWYCLKPFLAYHRHAFEQVSEFDRGRIVAYRDCGLSFREIGSRVGRNQETVMRIYDCWMQEGTTHRRGRSHSPQCTTSRDDKKIVCMEVTVRSFTS